MLKSLVTLTIVGIVLIVVVFFFWMTNPYGLEPERRGPNGNESLPKLSITPDSKNYLLYDNYENNQYVIHLALPNQYIHESNFTNKISKSYSAYITMYYPNMNGKFHQENAHLTKCNGYCNGYLRASIEPTTTKATELNERKILRLSRERNEESHLRYYEDLEEEFGLSTHFQIRYPVLEEKSNGKKHSTKEYIVKYDEGGAVKYLFQCHPYTPSPACSVKFNLSSMPELLVNIRFSRSLLNDWENIIKMVDNKISSWKLDKISFDEE